MRKSGNFVFLILGVLVLVNILAWLVVWDLKGPHFLEVNFFDVGQGDAIFIVSPERHQILIDGGPSSAILEKLAKEMPFWDRTIDLVILTHPESDHLSGLIEVLKRYKVENILWTGVVRDTAEYREWVKAIEKEKARVSLTPDVKRLTTSGVNMVNMEILHPVEDFEKKVMKDSNPSSIVVRLGFLENSFLFTGDVTRSTEKELLDRGENISSDVLKVAHHGSKTSSSENFIEKVWPEIAVISAGKDNRYGYPHQEVLEILKSYDIRILRTDLDGDIKIISDGTNIKVRK